MTTPTDWIAMSERKPLQEDRPIWIHRPTMPKDYEVTLLEGSSTPHSWDAVTHWKPATIPAPPPKPRTQREEDEAEYFRQFEPPSHDVQPTPETAWKRALAYRDAQNRADLADIEEAYCDGLKPSREKLKRLHKRCGL